MMIHTVKERSDISLLEKVCRIIGEGVALIAESTLDPQHAGAIPGDDCGEGRGAVSLKKIHPQNDD